MSLWGGDHQNGAGGGGHQKGADGEVVIKNEMV